MFSILSILAIHWSIAVASDAETIYEAIYSNDQAAVLSFIQKGDKLEQRDKFDQTPLEIAVYKSVSNPSYLPMVELLLKKGAKVNQQRGGLTALHTAVSNSNDDASSLAVIEMLLKYHADPNIGASPSPKVPGITVLMVAAKKGKIKTAVLLLDHGARVDLKGPGNKTASEIANENGHPDIAKKLVEKSTAVK